jgi:hypothetical protein
MTFISIVEPTDQMIVVYKYSTSADCCGAGDARSPVRGGACVRCGCVACFCMLTPGGGS